jgi:hypothetical protein
MLEFRCVAIMMLAVNTTEAIGTEQAGETGTHFNFALPCREPAAFVYQSSNLFVLSDRFFEVSSN